MKTEKPIFQIFAGATWGGGEQFVADLSRRLTVAKAALARLLDDRALRDAMGAAGRRHFEENLAYEHFYRKYLALYHDRQTA